LNLSGGELVTHNTMWFNSGSDVNISGGILRIRRNLINNSGEFNHTGGQVVFQGDVNSTITGPTAFHKLEVAKDAGLSVISNSKLDIFDSLLITGGNLVINDSIIIGNK